MAVTKSTTKLARIATPNKAKGRVVRTYTWRSQKYEAGKGWYRVPNKIAEELAEFRNVDSDPESPKVFIIADTKEDAQAFDVAEAKARQRARRDADEPQVVVRDASQDAGLGEEEDGRDLAPPAPDLTPPAPAARPNRPARNGPPRQASRERSVKPDRSMT